MKETKELRRGRPPTRYHFKDYYNTATTSKLPLQFRHGDGLQPLQPDQADIVCMTGMGVHTMVNVLLLDDAVLDRLGTRHLLLQPTHNHSRPKHLIWLYQQLLQSNWMIQQERISQLDRQRWWLTLHFARRDERNSALPVQPLQPGCLLRHSSANDPQVVQSYFQHHVRWLQSDREKSGQSLRQGEEEWLREFETQ